MAQYNGKTYGLALNATHGLKILNLPRMTLVEAMAYRAALHMRHYIGAGVVVINLDSVN